jgi:RNA polymerase sigma-70 factor, ECF subfamily
LLRRLGQNEDAVRAYDEAIARTDNEREREFLVRSRDALAAS